MQKVFELTNKYIILATPLILFSLISTLYLAGTLNGRLINILIAMFLFALMTGAFIAGWFNMIKKAILEPDRDDANSLIKEFPEGVGEYFLSALGSLIIIFLLFSATTAISFFLGIKFIGDPGIQVNALNEAISNPAALKAFLASLSSEQVLKINLWNLLLMGTMAVSYFLGLLYMPALFFKSKNPIKAFFISLKDLFSKKFFLTLAIYMMIFILNAFISIFLALFSSFAIVHFVLTLLNFYFLTAVGVGIFYYYYNNFVSNQIGQNVDVEI